MPEKAFLQQKGVTKLNIVLSDFTSIFEIFIAINLLYSLVPDIQKAIIARAKLTFKHLERALEGMKRIEEWHKKEVARWLLYDERNAVDRDWDNLKPEERETIRQRRVTLHQKTSHFDKLFSTVSCHMAEYSSTILTIDFTLVQNRFLT